ncbi:MAG: PASTA domain-containing protein [Candidatus Hydrogenedens sp.]
MTMRGYFIPLIFLLSFTAILPSFAGEKIKYQLTIKRVGDEGIVNPGIGTFYYDAGTTVFLNAIPTADWAFDHWEGAVSGTDLFTQVLMDKPRTVTAVFVPAQWRLTIEHSGNATGTTFPAPGVYGFLDGRTVGVSSGTSPGVYFGGWRGDVISNEEFVQVVMNSDKYINARFTDTGYTLSISVIGPGGTTPWQGTVHRYSEGLSISVVSYSTNPLWRFDHWEGDIGDNESRYYILLQLTMDQDRNITAVFIEKPYYNLTLEIVGEGGVSFQQGFDDPVTLSTGIHEFSIIEWTYIRCEKIITSPTWKFLHWEGDFGDTLPTYYRCAFSMDKNRYVRCIFTNLTQVPDVIGTPQNIAETTIINGDLIVGNITEICNDNYVSGYVIDQYPPAGTTVEIGNSVSLWVSTGPCPVSVPNLIGLTIEEAENAINSAGLTLGNVMNSCNDEIGMGIVFGQNPLAGEQLFPGSSVNIEVSSGPCPAEGIIEGEGMEEGMPEGEGTPEGEVCVWMGACPNFSYEGIKMGYFVGQLWNNCDINQSEIPDAWEIEIVKYLLCNPQGIWEDKFICKFIENYNILATESLFHTTYYSFRHILTGLLTIGTNMDILRNTFFLTKNYYPFEYPSDNFPLLPDADIDNDELTNYEEYLRVVELNGSNNAFIRNIFNPSPVPPIHSADINQNHRIELTELLRIIQFFNSSGFHCENGTEDGYAPGYDESFDFSCEQHTADYLPHDWHISLEEILRMVQFFNADGYQMCPFISEDSYCPIFSE